MFPSEGVFAHAAAGSHCLRLLLTTVMGATALTAGMKGKNAFALALVVSFLQQIPKKTQTIGGQCLTKICPNPTTQKVVGARVSEMAR